VWEAPAGDQERAGIGGPAMGVFSFCEVRHGRPIAPVGGVNGEAVPFANDDRLPSGDTASRSPPVPDVQVSQQP